jgi:hypothetical protein
VQRAHLSAKMLWKTRPELVFPLLEMLYHQELLRRVGSELLFNYSPIYEPPEAKHNSFNPAKTPSLYITRLVKMTSADSRHSATAEDGHADSSIASISTRFSELCRRAPPLRCTTQLTTQQSLTAPYVHQSTHISLPAAVPPLRIPSPHKPHFNGSNTAIQLSMTGPMT